MLKPAIVFRDDQEGGDNSIEAHAIISQSTYKANLEIKLTGMGRNNLEALENFLEAITSLKTEVTYLYDFALNLKQKLEQE